MSTQSPSRPHVRLVMAMTADGKIASVARTAPHFGEADAERFERVCAESDALVTGAGSLRAQGATRTIVRPHLVALRAARGLPPNPLTCVVSRTGLLPLTLPFFRRQDVPRLIATTDARAADLAGYYGDDAHVLGCGPDDVSPARVLAHLAARGVHRVALLGGGELNAAWFAADLVDEIELTLAPLLFGGHSAPTPIDGSGLAEPRQLDLAAHEVVDGCLFVTYRVRREP
ncbi:MAG: dihydrofolate reductase family protein [Armatimonadetes bacterium]|nr:dihydrofolate reductase family protein [Armatimonadota bacterium]